jgi:hypothetical protein
MATAGNQDDRSAAASTPTGAPPDDSSSQIEGEGNYTAARRHRKSVEDFVDEGRVEEAAQDAAPDSAEQAEELRQAEDEGLRHARK